MHYILIFLVLVMLSTHSATAQNYSFAEKIYEKHENYKEKTIKDRRFKHKDLKKIIEALRNDDQFQVSKAGESVEGRNIYLVQVGTGKTNVLLWSQMHGDEPTATMAIMDIFNFFQQEDEFTEEKKQMLEDLSIYFIPMVNPDGAEKYTRRNAFDIDINRDAQRLQSPESRLLKSVRDSLDADFGFNLHDQDILWSAGKSGNPATISLLAPAYNYEKSVNEDRGNAMKIVVYLEKMLQQYIPGQVAKWSDDFEPRAFGDNMQKWGTSTILIESGGYKNDPEKQFIRKLNFTAILTALKTMADGSYKSESLARYSEIPENSRYLFDLVIRNASMQREGKEYTADLGIIRNEVDIEDHTDFYYSSRVDDLGDLSIYSGYDEIDAKGLTVVPGKIYPESFEDLKALDKSNIPGLLKEGYTSVKVNNLPVEKKFTQVPINIIKNGAETITEIGLGSRADFLLKKGEVVKYAIINGFIYDLEKNKDHVKNGLIK